MPIKGNYIFNRFRTKSKYHVASEELRTFNGIKFDSKAEMSRYKYLLVQQSAGVIHSLTLQPKFELQSAFINSDGKKERAITYIADFMYSLGEKFVVEDVKGVVTKEYAIKKKLFLFKYPGYIFREIHNEKATIGGVNNTGRSKNKSCRKTHSPKQVNEVVNENI